MGTNGSGDYIKGLIKKKEQKAGGKSSKKSIEEDPDAKKKEWLRLAAAFSR